MKIQKNTGVEVYVIQDSANRGATVDFDSKDIQSMREMETGPLKTGLKFGPMRIQRDRAQKPESSAEQIHPMGSKKYRAQEKYKK